MIGPVDRHKKRREIPIHRDARSSLQVVDNVRRGRELANDQATTTLRGHHQPRFCVLAHLGGWLRESTPKAHRNLYQLLQARGS